MFIEIPVSRMNDFKALAAKLQKKQAKYQMPVGSYNIQNIINKGNVAYLHIELANFAETIIKNDAFEYTFCGITKCINGVVQNYIENDIYIDYFKQYPDTCDHCKTNRKRNSYVVMEYNNKPVYIGSSCIKDYFGHNALEILSLKEKILLLREKHQFDDMTLSFNEIAHYIKSNISLKWEEIKNDTRNINELFLKSGCNQELDGYYELVKAYYSKQRNGFELNCYNALSNPFCYQSNYVIYFCAVYFAMKELIKATMPQSNLKVVSNYQIGERITREVKVLFTKEYFNCYDYRHLKRSLFIKMLDKLTNEILSTTTSSAGLQNVCQGDEITITGTVDGIKEYKGQQSWNLTRCK